MSRSPFSDPPPGLVGEVAKFIYDAAPRPVAEIALAGAIGLMAGVCGRAYNVSGTGLNLYVLLIAETGTGKEAIASGISALAGAMRSKGIGAVDFVGPAEIASSPALLKYIAHTSNSFVSVLGEFGIALQQMTNPRAPSHLIGVKRVLLDLYNKSGRTNQLQPSIYSDREKNIPVIQSPALSLIGETTPGRLYEALDESLIADGLLPRFTIIEYRGNRPRLNRARRYQPDPAFADDFANLCAYAASLNGQGNTVDVLMSPDAEAMFDAFNDECDDHINGTKVDVHRHLWNRAHIKAMKLAALIAVGERPHTNPVVSPEHAAWALALERNNIANLLTRFENGETGGVSGDEVKQMNDVVRCIREYMSAPWQESYATSYGVTFEMHDDRVFTETYLSRRVLPLRTFKGEGIKGTAALKRAIDNLIAGDEIREIPKNQMQAKYGRHPRGFAVSAPRRFAEARP